MSEDLKAKLRWGIEELFNKANIDLLGELYAENIVVRRPPFPDTAGLAAVREDTDRRADSRGERNCCAAHRYGHAHGAIDEHSYFAYWQADHRW